MPPRLTVATVAVALLLGCLAAFAAVGAIVVALMLGTGAAGHGGLRGLGEAIVVAAVVLALTASVMLPRLLLALPLAAFAAWRYRGGLWSAAVTGALAGAALEFAWNFATAVVGPPAFKGGLHVVLGAVAGAAFVWPVWHRCVAPRRRARDPERG